MNLYDKIKGFFIRFTYPEVIKRNYNAVINRGCITPETTIIDFIEKMEEEFHEVCNAHIISEKKPNPHLVSEVIDLIVVCINFLIFYRVNIIKGLIKNAIKNEGRVKKK